MENIAIQECRYNSLTAWDIYLYDSGFVFVCYRETARLCIGGNFSVTLFAGYIDTPVGGDKCLSL